MSDFQALTGQNNDDLLWQQLKTIPAFRALLRSVEARFYRAIYLPQPTLDVGCGDGHFARVAFDQPITAGIDPWWGPLKKAKNRQTYMMPSQSLGDSMPFADCTFASAFSNSVLEHIPDVQPVLTEVSRVMQPEAPFVLTVPSQYFTEFLGGASIFDRLGLSRMAGQYRALFNKISRHAHTDPPEIWAERLVTSGFTIERWQYYFSEKALRTLELGHAQGLPSAILHAFTGHWVLGPWENNLRRTEQWVRPYYEEEFPEHGAYLFFLARKTMGEPPADPLPPPHPYSLAELNENDIITTQDPEPTLQPDRQQDVEADNHSVELRAANHLQLTPDQENPEQGLPFLIPGLLVALTLFLAFLGQSALRATPEQPGVGIRWIALSSVVLLILLWRHRLQAAEGYLSWSWPNLSAIPRQRLFFLPAALLALFAYRLATSPAQFNPIFPIIFWIAAITLATYSLSRHTAQSEPRPAGRDKGNLLLSIKVSVLLFLVSLLVRLYDLGQHPFILNGTEASIGLEALKVLQGLQSNPFSTGWLTNPVLPFYLLAVPLRLFGQSTESLRLLSAFIGAATVPVLFLVGQRLYGRVVGLLAAILLAGSHFHVHFSRSGTNNAWDALLTLLSLGLIGIAWHQAPGRNRRTWLAAGVSVGLSAYLYTSSHLLPIMLLALGMIELITDRHTWERQWRNVLSMTALALIVALPQLLHYQASPGIYMERANVLGIFDGQSGWLTNEATRTGSSQLTLLSDQFWQAALAFNATIDTSTSYGPSAPLLNFVFGLLAVIGFVLALFRLRHIQFSLLVVWLGVTVVFAGALLENPPNSHRLIIAIPVLCLLAALAIDQLAQTIIGGQDYETVSPSITQARFRRLTVLVVIVIAIAAYDIGFYFGTYRSDHRFGDRNTEVANDMAIYLNSLQGDWVAHFFGPPSMYVGFPTIPFLATQFEENINLFDVPEGGVPLPGYENRNQTFLFLPERYNELEQVRAAYPLGREQSVSGYYADPLFYVYEVRENP